jgi:hypothetical protein
MKLLFVSELHPTLRAISTITNYAKVGKELGHEVAVFGEQSTYVSSVPYSLDVGAFDFAILVVYTPADFPGLPYLARLLDRMPRDRRIVIDCCGRYNDTIRVEHDFNHLEKLDGHQSWEWIEGFQAMSDKILQPTLTPLRKDVRPFLFHGFDPAAVERPYRSAREAAQSWSSPENGFKAYGVIYVGNNWQRWTQIRRFLELIEPLKSELGPIRLVGWDWNKRPDWAIEHGLAGVDVDPEFLQQSGVETTSAIPFSEVIGLLGKGRFSPVFHRPLFNHLQLVTNRTFETFCADTIPLLMLSEDLIDRIYGADALCLAPGDNVVSRLNDMMGRPEAYWDAILKTRARLAEHHSYRYRFQELLAILEQ